MREGICFAWVSIVPFGVQISLLPVAWVFGGLHLSLVYRRFYIVIVRIDDV